ncbi:MAG: cysteine hydrolase [Alphaproteobacteria bacterium]|nr:cysteine hydrolase [Alphaproteobacteria bacterium]
MTTPKTLLQMAGANLAPPRLQDAAVVLIDCQMEYVSGGLKLPSVDDALDEVLHLTAKARRAGAPIIHIVHGGQAGGLFDLDGPGGQIAPQAAPVDGETVVGKSMPNGFAHTDLDEKLRGTGKRELIVAGFMTHMCVSSTIRAAVDLGYRSTLVAGAAATRDLPQPGGDIIDAGTLHRATVAALADRFAIIVANAAALEE